MPWKASSVMEEKARFVLEYERDEQTMSELCEQFGIARETGYVWLRRYRAQGPGRAAGVKPGGEAASQPDGGGDGAGGAGAAAGAHAVGTAEVEASVDRKRTRL